MCMIPGSPRLPRSVHYSQAAHLERAGAVASAPFAPGNHQHHGGTSKTAAITIRLGLKNIT